MAKMSGNNLKSAAGGSATKRSDHNDMPIGAPSRGMGVRSEEKGVAAFPPRHGSGMAKDMRGTGNQMEDPKVLTSARAYLHNMHNEVKGPGFSQDKSIHGRMAGESTIDRRED